MRSTPTSKSSSKIRATSPLPQSKSLLLPINPAQKALKGANDELSVGITIQKSSGEKVSSKRIIRDLGLKVTNQRVLILDIVRKGGAHFTAQEIYERVADQTEQLGEANVGFATVYRFLRQLSENHYVTEVRMGGMPARYEWAAKNHHDHLTCTACQTIVEFENVEIERLQARVAKQFGFTLTDHVLELYGLCPDCQSR